MSQPASPPHLSSTAHAPKGRPPARSALQAYPNHPPSLKLCYSCLLIIYFRSPEAPLVKRWPSFISVFSQPGSLSSFILNRGVEPHSEVLASM